MYWDVIVVKPLRDFRIYVEINDGRRGIFDVKPYLSRQSFHDLCNESYFNQVSVHFGAVTWPNDQDIAPDTLIDEMIPVDALPSDALAHSN